MTLEPMALSDGQCNGETKSHLSTAICNLHVTTTRAAQWQGNQSRTLPPHMAPFCHLIFDDVDRVWVALFHQRVLDTPGCFGLSEHNLALVILVHSLPSTEVSPGTSLLAWHSLLSDDVHACLLIWVNDHWPQLLDELLLQPQWECKGKKKYDFKPKCPLGSILEFYIGIR